jgi:sugar phosphate isomerase/epimerase
MKIALAIASEKAIPTAFVVFRDKLETSITKAARLGYDAIELALARAEEAHMPTILSLLRNNGLELAAISTGRVFAEERAWFTHPDLKVRQKAVDILKGLIELAAEAKSQLNVGRVRGFIHEGDTRETAESRFIECMSACADYAAPLGVRMLLEPVNRYEINFVNSVPEAQDLLVKIGRPNVKIMPDVFHMNIEDASIYANLRKAGGAVGYIHFADSNRWPPGQGHLNFPAIYRCLQRMGYKGFIGIEILPYPDPDTAAKLAIDYMKKLRSKNP